MNHKASLIKLVCVISLLLTSVQTTRGQAVSTPTGIYLPAGEIVLPFSDDLITRAAEEKDGYVYLLTRVGDLYTYNVSDLPGKTTFATYNTPISSLNLANGNGLLRNGDALYVFGINGLTVLSIQNPAAPASVGSVNDLEIFNLVKYDTYLIAPGDGGIAVYSIADPVNPVLLSIYSVPDKEFMSAAVYGNILYTSERKFLASVPPTNIYYYGFRILDFSDPSELSMIRLIDRNTAAYHLRIVGNKLIECAGPVYDASSVGLWSLEVPSDPVLETEHPVAGGNGRVCAQDGDKIVINGTAFRPDGNSLDIIDDFSTGPGGGVGRDPAPYGSAVTPGYVFIAQSQRILILKKGDFVSFDARLDKGMPYSVDRGCPSPYLGCGGPFHGFFMGASTDLVLDGYHFGLGFDIQSALVQDRSLNPGRYRYGSARNAEDMRRYFTANQGFLPHSQPYQPGDIAFFDWNGDGLTNHVLIISGVDPDGRPLKMVDASGVIPGINFLGRAFEHDWTDYYEQQIQGHARLIPPNSLLAPLAETQQNLRVTASSAIVELSLFDSNGKSVSGIFDENLVANNNESAIPYIPGGSFEAQGPQSVINVRQPLANTNQYYVRIKGLAQSENTLLVESLQDDLVTASQSIIHNIDVGEVYTIGLVLSETGGSIGFTAQPPMLSPDVSVPFSLSLSAVLGGSAHITFTVAETSDNQAINNASFSASDLSTQYGIKIPSNELVISPAEFDVPAGGSQQVDVQVDLTNVYSGEYLGRLLLTPQNGNPVMILLILKVQYHNIYLPVVNHLY